MVSSPLWEKIARLVSTKDTAQGGGGKTSHCLWEEINPIKNKCSFIIPDCNPSVPQLLAKGQTPLKAKPPSKANHYLSPNL